MSAPPLPEVFGNYALGDFVEVVSPAGVSWWPQTVGWLWLGAGLLAYLGLRLWRFLHHWYRNRYRREAIARLQALSTAAAPAGLASELNRLLKLAALAAFPREQVARLSGPEWIQFLNAQCPTAVFSPRQCQLLAEGPYSGAQLEPADASQLLAACVAWVRNHENPRMFELAHPWALALLALPLLMRLLPAYKESRDSVRVPFFDKLVALSERRPETGAMVLQRDRAQQFLVNFMWLCLVLAAAKPEWIGPPVEQQKSGRDLMIAVDLSGSMETLDFTLPNGSSVNRLDAVKYVLAELTDQHASDRLGLIVFGNAPYLQSPFTDDHTVWAQLLADTRIGMAGQSTAFGDAIGLAIKLFRESDSDNRVLIMLTDGNDTGSMVPPVDAAKVAASDAIRIYTIAIGDPASVGEEALDIDTLQRVSELTGGRYFQALDQQQLLQAYQTVGELEPELYETISFRPRQSLHWVPVSVALSLYLLYHALGAWRSWRREVAANAS